MRHVSTPEPYFVSVPATSPKSKVVAWTRHPVLSPSDVLLWLLETTHVQLEELATLEHRGDLQLYNKMAVLCKQHSLLLGITIALGTHGDGVPYQKSTHKHSTTEVYSWNMLLKRRQKVHVQLFTQGLLLQLWLWRKTHTGCYVGSLCLGPHHALWWLQGCFQA